MKKSVSIILPARNESAGIGGLLQIIREDFPHYELIVVDDGSSDQTAEIAKENNSKVVSHPYTMGNGAAIKNGARAATGEILVFMDADGQHDPSDIGRLLDGIDNGFEMVIGARKPETHASIFRRVANTIYNKFASLMTGVKIDDLTSGFRAVRARKFKEFLYLLPNGFSYPTTITMAFIRAGFPITYVPIEARKREGKSKIRPIKDGTRFLLIIVKIGTLFSPMRVFFPISVLIFLTGALYYTYTFLAFHRLTNMGAILLISSLIIFLIGVIAEQISSLHYQSVDKAEVHANMDSDQ